MPAGTSSRNLAYG